MKKSYTTSISLIVAMGGFLLGFDSAVIFGAVNGIRTYFEMSDWELGFSVGCVIFGAMAGNIFAGPLSDKYGRKKLLIVTAMLFTISAIWSALATDYISFVIAIMIGGVGIGGAILIAPLLSETQFLEFKQNEVKNFISINANLVLIAILLYVAAFAISLGPVMWTMLSEIFPGNVKGIAISIVGFFNSLVSYTVTQFFPWELTNLGPTVTFAIYAGMAVLSVLFVYKYVIETKGKTLEEVEELLIKS